MSQIFQLIILLSKVKVYVKYHSIWESVRKYTEDTNFKLEKTTNPLNAKNGGNGSVIRI